MTEHIQARLLEVAIQLGESSDVSYCSQLLVFVRYASDTANIEELLFCEPLELTNKGFRVFNRVICFFL